jgi:hypothetical protein
MSALHFTCGIDIGTKNLCISFVPIGEPGIPTAVTSYKGSLESVSRYETDEQGVEVIRLSKRDAAVSHEAYIKILKAIPEFSNTLSTVIEEQLSFNKSNMSRLDGVTYGFLRGSFPQMGVYLHGSTIRQKFITDALAQQDISRVVIPKGYPESKELSFYYVGCLFQEHYEYIHLFTELRDKLDDICDSVVYAGVARTKPEVGRLRRSTPAADKSAAFAKSSSQ